MHRLVLVIAGAATLSACSTLFPQQACEPAPAAPAAAPSPAVETDAQRQERLMWELSTKSIFFDSGINAVKPEYLEFLHQVAYFLRSAPEISVALIGNADERGGGQVVSGQKRAEAVRRYLSTQGIPLHRMSIISYGLTAPIADNSTPEGRAINRRVTIVVLQ
jgi:outer membrane protein OmpA-like peptidoglycan-associated protein